MGSRGLGVARAFGPRCSTNGGGAVGRAVTSASEERRRDRVSAACAVRRGLTGSRRRSSLRPSLLDLRCGPSLVEQGRAPPARSVARDPVTDVGAVRRGVTRSRRRSSLRPSLLDQRRCRARPTVALAVRRGLTGSRRRSAFGPRCSTNGRRWSSVTSSLALRRSVAGSRRRSSLRPSLLDQRCGAVVGRAAPSASEERRRDRAGPPPRLACAHGVSASLSLRPSLLDQRRARRTTPW